MDQVQAKKVALFGGAFDPPHLGHVVAVTLLLNSRLIDEVWLIPAGDDRRDKKPVADAASRRKMVELMLDECFQGVAQVRLNPIQLEGELPGSFTIDLWDRLKRDYPAHIFYFVIGADNLKKIADWKDPQRLAAEVQWMLISRPGEKVPEYCPFKFICVPNKSNLGVAVSSSALRSMIKHGHSLVGLIPRQVLEYIAARKLYN